MYSDKNHTPTLYPPPSILQAINGRYSVFVFLQIYDFKEQSLLYKYPDTKKKNGI